MPGASGISILLYEKRSLIVHHAEVDDERRSVGKKKKRKKDCDPKITSEIPAILRRITTDRAEFTRRDDSGRNAG